MSSSRLRVVVDYRPALRARTGAGAYVHQLVQAYTARSADQMVVFSSSWKDRVAPSVAADLKVQVVDRRVPVQLLNYLWHRHQWPPVETLAGPADIVHAGHPLLIPARSAAQVVTVHDLYFLSHPDDTSGEVRRDYPDLVRAHVQRADAVVTSSHYTKTNIVRLLGVDQARVHLVRPGAPTWATPGRAPALPSEGYILFLGTLEPRKNLGVLLDAYERLIGRGRAVPSLVVAGAAGLGAQQWIDRMNRAPLRSRVTYRGYVREADREQLFRGARAVVLPSWDEGFGLPALEGMAVGTPVIVSNAGALPEVVGDAGVLVSPDDPDAWAQAIERITHDDAWAQERAAAGLDRARAFQWPDAADALGVAYAAAVERRRVRG